MRVHTLEKLTISLNKHMATLNDPSRKYSCIVCQADFTRADHLQEHLRSHEVKKKFGSVKKEDKIHSVKKARAADLNLSYYQEKNLSQTLLSISQLFLKKKV